MVKKVVLLLTFKLVLVSFVTRSKGIRIRLALEY